MKKYFIDKLTELVNGIERTQKKIIEEAASLNVQSLINLTQALKELKAGYEAMVFDTCKYCTVQEVVEIATLRDSWKDVDLNLLKADKIESYYRHHGYGITYEERELLRNTFKSRGFSEVKIK